MRVLVTGGTGFVGSWTARAVQDAGHQVRFLVRDPARLSTAAGALGVDTDDAVTGDITDRASVRRALDGCDAVIHCAAIVAIGPGAADRMAANLDGARHVLGQAIELGLDPVVHVSSVAAVFRPGLRVLTGDLPVAVGLDDYGASKAQVERYARDLQDRGAPLQITYPGMVVGPPAGRQVGEGTDGVRKVLRLGVVPGGRDASWTVCDVRDLGEVHAALLGRRGSPGRWAAGGIRLTAGEVAEALTRATGRRVRHLPVPDPALRGLGRLQDRLGMHLPMAGDITGPAMEYYTRMPESDNDPLERELGVVFRDPYVTLSDAVSGLRAAGML
jgi:nucleoside-diphosphate-sugar epimerase